MIDEDARMPIVAADRLDGQLLRIECPFCHRTHYHCARSPYSDIREANCLQKHLRKKVRNKVLHYLLHYDYEREAPTAPATVIPFPSELLALARLWDE